LLTSVPVAPIADPCACSRVTPTPSASSRFPALTFSSEASNAMLFSPARGTTAVKVTPPPSGSARRPLLMRVSADVEAMSAESAPRLRPRRASD
jgi:hypothetical protein